MLETIIVLKIVRVHCRQTQLFYCTLFKTKKDA